MFCNSFYYFFSPPDLRGRWADLREILPHGQKHVQFTNAGPKIWGPALYPPQKNWGKKHAKFGLILDPSLIWARISPEKTTISKKEN